MSSHGSQQVMSPLLRLPAHIRNMIYYHAVVEPDCGCVPPCAKDLVYLVTLSEPPLSRVNKQLREECLPVFYKNNRFSILVEPGPELELRPMISERNVSRFFDPTWNGRDFLPQESHLRLVQAIQMSWSPLEAVDNMYDSLTGITVSFGLRSESRSAVRLLIERWSKFEVESAIFSAFGRLFQLEPLKYHFNIPEVQRFVEMVWLCGANFPKATGHVELHIN